MRGILQFDEQITANDVLHMIETIDRHGGIDIGTDGLMGLGEARRGVLEELGFEGVIDKTPKKRFRSMPFMETDTEHVITFPRFKSNVKSPEAIFDEKTPTRPELFLNEGGEVKTQVMSYPTPDQMKSLRDQHMEELENIEKGLFDDVTPARLANIGGLFAPGAGVADIAGAYPEFPEADASVGEMLTGETVPSLAENIAEGNYGTAVLQGLGGVGDALYAMPVVGPLAGATVGSALKTPLAISKLLKILKVRNPEEAITKLDKMDLDETVQLEKSLSNDPDVGGTVRLDDSTQSGRNLYHELHRELETTTPQGKRALDLLRLYDAENLSEALEKALQRRNLADNFEELDFINDDILDIEAIIKARDSGDTYKIGDFIETQPSNIPTTHRVQKQFIEEGEDVLQETADIYKQFQTESVNTTIAGVPRTIKIPKYLRKSYILSKQGKINQSPEEILDFGQQILELDDILVKAMKSSGDDLNVFKQNPAVQKAVAQLNEIPLTSANKNYLSDEWMDQRLFLATDGTVIAKGYEDGIAHLYETSKRLGWEDEGLKYTPTPRPAGEKRAFIIIGQPASGKSTVANPIARKYNATIIDADKIRSRIDFYKSKGYEVDVIDVSVNTENTTKRMLLRFARTGRIIPLDYIEHVGDAPTNTYNILRKEGYADGFTRVDNNVAFEETIPVLEDQRGVLSEVEL
jgi:hypothetical protein